MGADPAALAGFDRERSRDGQLVLGGVDEAGRGCWAGPVVAAAVVLPAGWCPPGLDDSKKLSPARREALYAEIRTGALAWAACAVSAAEIDHGNILRATLRAMSRAVARLHVTPDLLLVDGNQVPAVPMPAEAIVRGDGTSAAIAAASILAKVLRDRVMTAWEHHFPGYGFAAHKGYGAAEHRQALERLGPCPLHRLTYEPLASRGQGRLF
ncbi:MAG: ribonuclease HII [bacterium]|nr:ribonuclease HII [bacterium]